MKFPKFHTRWQIRCLTCGRRRDAAEVGIVRIGAGRKYTLGWCSRCRRLRCCVIEPLPADAAGEKAPAAAPAPRTESF